MRCHGLAHSSSDPSAASLFGSHQPDPGQGAGPRASGRQCQVRLLGGWGCGGWSSPVSVTSTIRAARRLAAEAEKGRTGPRPHLSSTSADSLSLLSLATRQAELLFDLMDEDGDQALSREECLHFVRLGLRTGALRDTQVPACLRGCSCMPVAACQAPRAKHLPTAMDGSSAFPALLPCRLFCLLCPT